MVTEMWILFSVIQALRYSISQATANLQIFTFVKVISLLQQQLVLKDILAVLHI